MIRMFKISIVASTLWHQPTRRGNSMSNHVAKSNICLGRQSTISQFHFIENVSKKNHCAKLNAYQINKKTCLFPCKMSSYTRIREEVAKWFLDKTDETIISPTPPPWQMINVGGKNVRLYCLYWLAYWWTQKLHCRPKKTSVCMKCAWIVCFFGVKSCYMTTAYFSSLPPLKQKLWGNFHDYERALVTTEQEN